MLTRLFLLLTATLLLPSLGAQDRARKPAQSSTPPSAAQAAQPQTPTAPVLRFCGQFRLPDGSLLELTPDASGTGLVLHGVDAKSAVLVMTGKPADEAQLEALVAAEQRVQKALSPLVTGRGEVDAAQFANAQAVAAVEKAIAALRPQVGAQARVVYAGSDLSARTTWAVLRGAAGSVAVAVQWSAGGKVAGLAQSKVEPPARAAVSVPRPDWAVGQGALRGMTISVEGRGAGRVLVVENAQGLAVCPWKGDVR
jgi:hypothetical protein